MRRSSLTRAGAVALAIAAGALPATTHAASGDIELRRDGSKAVQAPPDLAPAVPRSDAAFDWGDAALGAGAGALMVAAGFAGALSLRERQVAPNRKPLS